MFQHVWFMVIYVLPWFVCQGHLGDVLPVIIKVASTSDAPWSSNTEAVSVEVRIEQWWCPQ